MHTPVLCCYDKIQKSNKKQIRIQKPSGKTKKACPIFEQQFLFLLDSFSLRKTKAENGRKIKIKDRQLQIKA